MSNASWKDNITLSPRIAPFFLPVKKPFVFFALYTPYQICSFPNAPLREKQYKDRLAAWNVRKNIKAAEVQVLIRKKQKRAARGKQTAFRRAGHEVDQKRLTRFVRRYGQAWVDKPRDKDAELASPEPSMFFFSMYRIYSVQTVHLEYFIPSSQLEPSHDADSTIACINMQILHLEQPYTYATSNRDPVRYVVLYARTRRSGSCHTCFATRPALANNRDAAFPCELRYGSYYSPRSKIYIEYAWKRIKF